MDPEEVRQEVRRLNMVGLKVYQHFAPGVDTWEAEIEQFLCEEHVRIAHEEELVVLLHMVKSRALADPANQAKIRYYCENYPGSWRMRGRASIPITLPRESIPSRDCPTCGSICRPSPEMVPSNPSSGPLATSA